MFPTDCITPAEKTEYGYCAQELLRLEHNRMGKLYKDGKISKDEWETFLKNTFEPTSIKIGSIILEARKLLTHSERWKVNLEEID